MRRASGTVVALGLASAALFGLASERRAAADEPAHEAPTSGAAQEHYTAGRESFRAGLYGRALEEFERSLALAPSPNTRLYLARTLRELGRWSESAEQYRATIREADERGTKYAATHDAAELELRDVKVRIDRGDAAARTERPAPSGDKPAPHDEPAAAPPPASLPSRAEGAGPTTLTWVSGGVAVAGAASFAVLYGLSGGRYGYLEDHCTTVRDAACDSARTTGKTEEVVAYVSLGVAATAAAVAIISLVVRPSSSGTAAAAVRRMGTWRVAF